MPKQVDQERLGRGIRRGPGACISLAREVFRATAVRYANRDDLLTGLGARSAGGRWNPPGLFAAVYSSLRPETALAEYLAQHRYFGWPESSAMPYVQAAIEVSLRVALDLTDGAVRRSLGVSRARMLDNTWREPKPGESLSQAIGRVAYESGIEGLLVPSSADLRGTNLIVFPGNLNPPGSWLRIVNRDRLPPPPRT